MESNLRYFARRAAEEEAKAKRALTEQSAQRHLQLATQFRSRLAAAEPARL
jgi:hypothetical protein